jgi:hypothetical protein
MPATQAFQVFDALKSKRRIPKAKMAGNPAISTSQLC